MTLQEIKNALKLSKPIYLHGKSGTGKTTLLKQFEHAVFVSIQDIEEFDDLYKVVQPSIVDIFHKAPKKKICVIDNIDFLHTHEKKIMTQFLKQFKLEEKKKKTRTFSLILCGTNSYDKKIKEIMKYCTCIQTNSVKEIEYNQYEKSIQTNIKQIMTKSFKDDFMIENEKATQALLFHENLIDVVQPNQYPFYQKILQNLCVGDYFDRISFQKQLWIFNEMTYYIKLLHNYYLYQESKIVPKKVSEYRFTKVLTKYSNEYNNNTFIIGLCHKLNCSKKDLFYKLVRQQTDELTTNELNRVLLYFQLKV
jgi:chromosomal replication initiation ATPase DnaA